MDYLHKYNWTNGDVSILLSSTGRTEDGRVSEPVADLRHSNVKLELNTLNRSVIFINY